MSVLPVFSSKTGIAQSSRNADEYWQLAAAEVVTVLDRWRWGLVQEAMGANAGWLFWERVRKAMKSGRYAGGWVGGVVAARGGAPLELR